MPAFFIENLFTNPQLFFMWTLIIVFSVSCHEYSHAQMALWQGDSTAADAGHLTLNPLRQMGLTSLIMLAFIGIAWGAVPVNPSRMKHRYSDALVSFAGPAMNIVLFLVFTIALTLTFMASRYANIETNAQAAVSAVQFFYIGAQLNFVLFVFNMLPVPMFDGWGVVGGVFPKLGSHVNQSEFSKGIMLFVLLGALFFIEYLFMLGSMATLFLARGLEFVLRAVGL